MYELWSQYGSSYCRVRVACYVLNRHRAGYEHYYEYRCSQRFSLSLACVLLGTSKPMRLDLGLLGKQEGPLGQEPVAPKAGPKINRAEAHTHA